MSVHCVSDNDPRKNRLAIRLCQKHDIDRSTGLDLTELKSFLTHYKKEMKRTRWQAHSTLDGRTGSRSLFCSGRVHGHDQDFRPQVPVDT